MGLSYYPLFDYWYLILVVPAMILSLLILLVDIIGTIATLVTLFETYHAHVRIVYLEAPWDKLLERNSSREEMVPVRVIEDMLAKLSLPLAHEARKVEWLPVPRRSP